MVALSGRGWVLAPCLVDLMEETDRRCPGRSTASDGSVGDPAHAARDSDHNPDGGYVHAVDITDDDAHGCDISLLFAHLVATKDPRVKYLIHKGTIWKSYENRGLPPWTPQVYTGENSHTHHGHVSIKDGQEHASGTWWPAIAPLEEDDMYSDEDRRLAKERAELATKRHGEVRDKLDKILTILSDAEAGTVGRRTKEIALAVRKLSGD